jgi:hypothetical protein
MPIADAEHIQSQTRLGDEAVLAAKRRLRRAERWVRQRIGDGTYADAEAAADVSDLPDSPTDDEREAAYLREDVADAEALYAASRALHSHNLAGGQGASFLRVIQVDGEQSEQVMSASELTAYAEHFEAEAEEAIARHGSAPSDPLTTTMDRHQDRTTY